MLKRFRFRFNFRFWFNFRYRFNFRFRFNYRFRFNFCENPTQSNFNLGLGYKVVGLEPTRRSNV